MRSFAGDRRISRVQRRNTHESRRARLRRRHRLDDRRARPAPPTAPVPVTIVVFNPPSLGAVFPAVIKQQKFDIANGIDINFVERPPDAYAAQFNSGEFQVGGSASMLILGLGATRGIKTSYLFNLFDYWGTVVTSHPDIKTLADLSGKQFAAAKGTTNYTCSPGWRSSRASTRSVQGGQYRDAGPGRLRARRPRRRGAALGAGLFTLVKAQRPDIHTIDLDIAKVWGDYAGGARLALSRRRRAPGMDRRKPRISFPGSIAPISWPRTGCRPSGWRGAAGRRGQETTPSGQGDRRA